jgi:phage-related protein
MSATNILISIAAQTAQAVTELDKVNGALGRQMTTGEKVKTSFKKMAVPAAAAFTAISAAAISSVKGAEEAAAVGDKLKQVYDSMGYSDLADDAEAYAATLSKQIGVDDEIIKGAQTKLATFSEVTKSADTMARATGISADLAAAGFGSMDSASVMLGKALQDPIKGVGALSEVGVTFTDQQKKQIEAMVKAGDTAGAQAIIMGELEKQVGGVAAAGATSSEKLGVAFGEIGEAVGTGLLPAFEKLTPLIQGFADWAANNSGILVAIGVTLGVLAGAVLLVNGALAAWSAIVVIWSAVTTVATAVGAAFGAVIAFITSPIGLIVLAIAALIAIIVLLWQNWDTVSAALGKAWDWLSGKATEIFGAIKEWLAGVWDDIKTKAIEVWGSLKDWFDTTWTNIKTAVSEAWEAVKTSVSNGITAVVEFVKAMPGKILTAIGDIVTLLAQKGVDLIQGLINGYLSIWDTVLTFAGNIGSKVVGAVGSLGKTLYDKGTDLIQGFINGIKSMAGKILEAILGILPGPVRGIISGALGLRSAGPAGFESSLSRSGRAGGNSATFNFYGPATSNDARAVKRVLEGYDVAQGRYAGTPLRVAW